MTTTQFFRLSCAMLALSIGAGALQAHPIPGRDLLKFAQAPMVNTTIIDPNGTPGVYGGHDELSTAYGFGNAAQPPTDYSGRFMADDFADNLTSPVVHVRWWGSYRQDQIIQPVNKFLISFEDDIPAGPAPSFSRPTDVNNFNQVVNRVAGPLTPGSGTYTETLIRGPDLVVNESLYEYNAELHLGKEFLEKKDTVYWLKIVAMVDVPNTIQFPTSNPPPSVTQWGWHNRDYTVPNPLASPNVSPGETQVGAIGASPIWHFQDDAVEGDVRILPGNMGFMMPLVFQPQTSMQPTKYLDLADGPAGIPGTNFPGISAFSKDLAFEIYTTQIVPEPATCVLAIFGVAAIFARRRMS